MVAGEATVAWRGGTSILRGRAEEQQDWRQGLPRHWQGKVVVPACFVRHREYEICAERIVGYECEDQPCYCEHRVDYAGVASDAGRRAGAMPQYWEHLTAWRLIDGHWLILKRFRFGKDLSQTQEFFCLSEQMPR